VEEYASLPYAAGWGHRRSGHSCAPMGITCSMGSVDRAMRWRNLLQLIPY
jgi:hypothetical protein